MIETASAHPDPALVQSLQRAGHSDADVFVSLIAGPDLSTTEHTLNSFLHCCIDAARVRRFLVVDAGLSARDRAMLQERYGFLEFAQPGQLGNTDAPVNAPYWLHLGQGWRFFAPEQLITRLSAVLEAEPEVFQVAINYTDADQLTGCSATEDTVHRASNTGRYVRTDEVAHGPAMFDTARLDRAGGLYPIAELGRRAAAAGLRTATLDEVLCIRLDPAADGLLGTIWPCPTLQQGAPHRPAICLNMIVRNEAHIVTEVLDAAAPYISFWVIVDTGSDDGTQDLIRTHMHSLGIPGELHERPWRNFGHNRSEALTLAQGHADYIWVMDADDTVVGTPDFTPAARRHLLAALRTFGRHLLARAVVPRRGAGALPGRHPRGRRVGLQLLRRGARRGRLPHRISFAGCPQSVRAQV